MVIPENRPEDRSALSGKVPGELLRRKYDYPTQMRAALSARLVGIGKELKTVDKQVLELAAQTLDRDEQNNAEMVDVLVRAGYHDVPARIDAAVIRRLLGYITPS